MFVYALIHRFFFFKSLDPNFSVTALQSFSCFKLQGLLKH